jgi:hypothetical protein
MSHMPEDSSQRATTPERIVKGTAVISPCGKYRYRLTRHIPCVLRWIHPCTFIMLNPSRATAETDDNTIKRCMGYAKAWQCTSLTVVNLFAYRTTYPSELCAAPASDRVGPENNRHILAAAQETLPGGVIVCAWGAHGGLEDRDRDVIEMLSEYPLTCLTVTKDGFPGHPLRLKAALQPIPLP